MYFTLSLYYLHYLDYHHYLLCLGIFMADIRRKAVKPSSLRCSSVQKAWFQPAPHTARTLTSTLICSAGETLSLPVRCAPPATDSHPSMRK